ncbi:MAG: hypothetical protein ACUVTX_00180 [Bacteroidales bacterium]
MKIRPVILMILTLVIGFILGILISAQVRFHRLKPVRIFFSEERFREGFYNILQPDEKQTQVINNILSRFGKANSVFLNEFFRKSDSLMREFWKEIEPNLTKEQIERLRDLDRRRMQMIRHDRRGREDSSSGFRPGRMVPPGPPSRGFEPGMRRSRQNDTTVHSRI